MPMKTDNEATPNLKNFIVKYCSFHADRNLILKRIVELKSKKKMFSMRSETVEGLSSCSNFPQRPSLYELESDKPVFLEIENLRGKIGEGDFKSLKEVSNRKADVFFQNIRRILIVAFWRARN